MKKKNITAILMMTILLLLGMTIAVHAESTKTTGHCWFDGGDTIKSNDFSSDMIASSIDGLEPGDDVTFRVEYKNKYDAPTYWYMRSNVLKTLEQSFDRTENGGYTFRLTNITPSGKRQVLFSNEAVGGDSYKEGRAGKMEGLHQATNATKEWFYIQKLNKGQKAYTELYVKFDGESEVNDYMDTYGKLMVAYAVELDKAGTTDNSKKAATSETRTGDPMNLMLTILMMTISLLLAVLLVLSLRRDRKEGEQA